MNRLITLIFLFPFFTVGQNRVIDSLNILLKNSKHDTVALKILTNIIDLYGTQDALRYAEEGRALAQKGIISATEPTIKLIYEKFCARFTSSVGYYTEKRGDLLKAMACYNEAMEKYIALNDKSGIASTHFDIAITYGKLGDSRKELANYQLCLSEFESLKDKQNMSRCLSKLTNYYLKRGEVKKAIDNSYKALKLSEEVGDKLGIADALNKIAYIYANQNDVQKAIELAKQSLKIFEETGNKGAISNALNAIGFFYDKLGEIDDALEYFNRSLKIEEEMNDKKGVAECLHNIAFIYDKKGDHKKALEIWRMVLETLKTMPDKRSICNVHMNIARVLLQEGKNSEALAHAKSGFEAARSSEDMERICKAANILKNVYKQMKNYSGALEMYEIEIKLSDSLNNESTRKASIKSQLKYEYEKQAAADSVAHSKESEIKNVELKRQFAEIKAKKNQQYALFGGLFLVILFAVFMFNRFRVTQKQKGIIEQQKEVVEEQKKLVEEKQHEILDSIKYARRIQMAQIPSEKMIAKSLERLMKV